MHKSFILSLVLISLLVGCSDNSYKNVKAGPIGSTADESIVGIPASITLLGDDYYTSGKVVEDLPSGYTYWKKLSKDETIKDNLVDCDIYIDEQDKSLRTIYVYQQCGNSIDEDIIDDTELRWAYVEWRNGGMSTT